jgi:hypothetical protein
MLHSYLSAYREARVPCAQSARMSTAGTNLLHESAESDRLILKIDVATAMSVTPESTSR